MDEQQVIELRNLELRDYLDLKQAMIQAYAQWDQAFWTEAQVETLVRRFPEGQFCVTVDGKVVGSALSIVVDYAKYGDDHTYREITDGYRFGSHDAAGDVLYGIDVWIHPDYRGIRLGRRLYDARKALCERLNLRAIVFGGRIPNYGKYAAELSPREYLEKVRLREIHDPVLTFQLANDFHPRKMLRGYSEGDAESKEYAVLLEWSNIYYSRPSTSLPEKTVVRVGAVQWQMRAFPDVAALCEQIEFFVDAVSGYQSDFVLFPELFNAPLMAAHNHLPEAQAIRKLADHSEALRVKCVELAVAYNVNVVAGSMPVEENGHLFNVGYLCRRDGTWERYDKLHVTPNEVSAWGMHGGSRVAALDTDCGKIGVLICYDVEFPELARLLALQGMRILFVPFLIDTPNGYTRVRVCAQARAIENECFVVVAGSVGNLPKVSNMGIQFAQSGVFTPADFAFPTNGIKAEATPNAETVVVADVDLNLLKALHEYGSVQTMKDRRLDLYELRLKSPA